jgi:hypothetical protein
MEFKKMLNNLNTINKNRYFPSKALSAAFLILVVTFNLKAEKVDSLFSSNDALRLELRVDFTALQDEPVDNPQYHEGELVYYGTDGKSEKFSVKVMTRGHFRRNPETCSFPPLWVNFKKKEVDNTVFDNQDKLKLVTPCQDEEDVIQEYTIYKMYNEVTDLSMKARLARIMYIDTRTGKELFNKYSFFLEDKEHVAKRNEATYKDRFLTPFDLNRENFMKMAVFEYMIGNKDWYVSSRKNVIVMQPKDSTQALLAVPYDFDFAAIIDASYTKPDGVPDYLLSTRRVYKGLCYTEDEFNETFEFYRKLMPVFENIINDQNIISKYTKKQMIRYLDNYNTITENRSLFKEEFLNACETRKDYNLAELQMETK